MSSKKNFEFQFSDKFFDGTKSSSINQIPEICKKYMKYENNHYELIWEEKMIKELMASACMSVDFSCKDYLHSVPMFYKALK